MFLFRRSNKDPQESPDSLGQPPASGTVLEAQVADRRPRKSPVRLRPRDLQEANRLDFQQFLLRQILKGHYVAPISTPYSILDVGCGTGRWMFDVGQEFPSAQITGFDIDVPSLAPEPRYQFVRGNLAQGLPFSEKTFDFVHQRFMLPYLPAAVWPTLMKQMALLTVPGGWLEFVDATHLVTSPGAAGQQVQLWGEQICSQLGIDLLLPQHLVSMLKATPLLTDVHFMYLDVPLGDWGGRVGALMAKNSLSTYEHIKPLYQEYLRVDAHILDQVLADMPREWELFHSTCRIYVAYGRRS